jgi:hypothetical protein
MTVTPDESRAIRRLALWASTGAVNFSKLDEAKINKEDLDFLLFCHLLDKSLPRRVNTHGVNDPDGQLAWFNKMTGETASSLPQPKNLVSDVVVKTALSITQAVPKLWTVLSLMPTAFSTSMVDSYKISPFGILTEGDAFLTGTELCNETVARAQKDMVYALRDTHKQEKE